MGRAERRAEYQRKIDEIDALRHPISQKTTYSWAAVWFGAGLTVVGLAENQIMGATLGAMLCGFGLLWKSGLSQESARLGARRQSLVAALKSTSDKD